MKKSYCFAILMLVLGCLAFNASAISEIESATAMDYAVAGVNVHKMQIKLPCRPQKWL